MTISKFRKSDEYYEDEYDRLTIFFMKEKINEWIKKIESITEDDLSLKSRLSAHFSISELGARFAKNKRNKIQEWITTDERKDYLVNKYS